MLSFLNLVTCLQFCPEWEQAALLFMVLDRGWRVDSSSCPSCQPLRPLYISSFLKKNEKLIVIFWTDMSELKGIEWWVVENVMSVKQGPNQTFSRLTNPTSHPPYKMNKFEFSSTVWKIGITFNIWSLDLNFIQKASNWDTFWCLQICERTFTTTKYTHTYDPMCTNLFSHFPLVLSSQESGLWNCSPKDKVTCRPKMFSFSPFLLFSICWWGGGGGRGQ